MKIFEVSRKAQEEGGEFVLGVKDTGTHACYMIYGVLKTGEKGRLIKPGAGHEELVLAMRGDLGVSGKLSGTLREGTSFHIAGDDECFLENLSSAEAVYVVAGGHSEGGH
jgi:hypothetical protein